MAEFRFNGAALSDLAETGGGSTTQDANLSRYKTNGAQIQFLKSCYGEKLSSKLQYQGVPLDIANKGANPRLISRASLGRGHYFISSTNGIISVNGMQLPQCVVFFALLTGGGGGGGGSSATVAGNGGGGGGTVLCRINARNFIGWDINVGGGGSGGSGGGGNNSKSGSGGGNTTIGIDRLSGFDVAVSGGKGGAAAAASNTSAAGGQVMECNGIATSISKVSGGSGGARNAMGSSASMRVGVGNIYGDTFTISGNGGLGDSNHGGGGGASAYAGGGEGGSLTHGAGGGIGGGGGGAGAKAFSGQNGGVGGDGRCILYY